MTSPTVETGRCDQPDPLLLQCVARREGRQWPQRGARSLRIVFREDARKVPLSRFRLHCGERFRYEYDFTADWKLDVRLERVLPFDPKRALPSCIGGSRAAPPEDCAGTLDYLKRLDWYRSQLPLEELNLMAEAMQRFLDSDGNRQAIGDLDELREAIDRVEAYQDFQPERFRPACTQPSIAPVGPRS